MSNYRHWLGVIGLVSLGAVFIIAGAGKLLAQSGSYDLFAFPFFIPQPLGNAISLGLPYVEIIIGLLLVCGVATRFAAGISALLIACFIASNLSYMLTISTGPCGNCFGAVGGLSAVHALFLDAIMAGLVVVILTCRRGNFFNISPWFLTGHTVTRDA